MADRIAKPFADDGGKDALAGVPEDIFEIVSWIGGTWRSEGSPIDRYIGPLPGFLAEIDRAIGRPLTLKFIKRFGGTRVYVPGFDKGKAEDSLFASVVGPEAALAVARIIGGNEMRPIPLGPLSIQWMKTMAIRRLLVGGSHTIAQIAWLCAANERSVYGNMRLLIDLGVLSERGRPTAITPSQYGLVGLLIADNTSPEDIARQLGVPLAEVERQAALMCRRDRQPKRGRL